jgi:hypothetical protein
MKELEFVVLPNEKVHITHHTSHITFLFGFIAYAPGPHLMKFHSSTWKSSRSFSCRTASFLYTSNSGAQTGRMIVSQESYSSGTI